MVKLGEIKTMYGLGNKRGRTIYTMDFDSISDFYNHCRKAPINTVIFKKMMSKIGKYEFTLTNSYEEAENLLLNGWVEGSKKLTTQLNLANKKVQSKEVKKAIYDIVGFQASVPRYLQGLPTSMINQKKVVQKQKVITLVKGMNYSATVKPQTILEDSIKFLQIVQAIESAGIRVNIDLISYSHSEDEGISIRLPIKKSSERLNLSKMSFPLTHPGFFRRMIFRARETEMRVKRSFWGFGYGQSAIGGEFDPVLKKNEYFIPPMIDELKALAIVNRVENDCLK